MLQLLRQVWYIPKMEDGSTPNYVIIRLVSVAFIGVATWFRNGTATYPPAARAISSQTPMWWTANGVY